MNARRRHTLELRHSTDRFSREGWCETPAHTPRPGVSHQPALTAAMATLALALVPCALLAAGLGQSTLAAATTASPPHSAPPLLSEIPSNDLPPGGLGDPAGAPAAAIGPTWPTMSPFMGLRTLTSCDSGRRMTALNAPPSDVPDGTTVGTTAAGGADSEQWIVWPTPGGELVLQSLLSSGAPEPRLVTAEQAGPVDLQHDRTGTNEDVAAQRWQFTGPTPLWADTDSRSFPGCFQIRAHDGGCLLDRGAAQALAVGDCGDRTAGWTDRGPHNPVDR
ncbi:hypothetical protein [Kitasatospora nipponensis]